MNSPSPSPPELSFSPSQALALIIGTFMVGFPAFLYWQLHSSLFGEHALLKVFAISGVGGILSFALYAGRKGWLVAGVLGFFGGIGGSGLLLVYTTVLQREKIWTSEVALVVGAGALPAMAVYRYINRRKHSHDT